MQIDSSSSLGSNQTRVLLCSPAQPLAPPPPAPPETGSHPNRTQLGTQVLNNTADQYYVVERTVP